MSTLSTVLRWLAVLLILRVLATILANYPDYFPPNFNSLFLEGREETFSGIYVPAFYLHIFSSPFVLASGLILMSEHLRRRYRGVHRILGRIHVGVMLLLMLPSSIVMSWHAFGGWPAGLSFLLLSLTTAACAGVGVIQARRRRYQEHRRWMLRCYVLICSAVTLRLISGTVSLLGVANAEAAYFCAAWCSWLVPLAALEIVQRWPLHAGTGLNRTTLAMRYASPIVSAKEQLGFSDERPLNSSQDLWQCRR